MFDTVLVVSDRTVIDSQLQEAVFISSTRTIEDVRCAHGRPRWADAATSGQGTPIRGFSRRHRGAGRLPDGRARGGRVQPAGDDDV